MKKVVLLVITLLLAAALSGCCISHDWGDATCTAPVTCTKCEQTEGEPLGHKPTKATCTAPSVCMVCTERLSAPLGHDWIDATETTPKFCSVCAEMLPMAEPQTGEVIISAKKCYSKLTIDGENSQYPTYVILKNSDGEDIISFYVRAGDSTTVKVPKGKFYVYFASGYSWYGPQLLFGEHTVYDKTDELLNFSSYYYTFTLGEPSSNG